jgi:hypothetical protein
MKAITIAGNIVDFLVADFDTGQLTWLERVRSWFQDDRSHSTWNARYAGKLALTYIDPHGYCCGRLFDQPIKAHRAIWALATGAWPEAIDHINGQRADNRLVNLRAVSSTENARNARKRQDNNSGVVGVCWDANRKKWLATASGRFVGRFDDFSAAVAARTAQAAAIGFHQNHGRNTL